MAIVRIEKLSKQYRQDSITVNALSDIELKINKGEFLALVGPSGSGKTTLLNLIGGLDSPSQGKIWVGDEEIGRLSRQQLSRLRLWKIGFIFQEYNLIPVLSALENVEYVMLLQNLSDTERREAAMAVLQEVGLKGLEHRRPAELSGGQQQRVAVARAIVSQPNIVLADEPTANLDSTTGKALLDLMRSLNERHGITFIFSTHDTMVMERAKRLITLRDGRIVEDKIQDSSI
ncbi:MAG: ABC transporter ATP-binding protein [Gammaproteobacteria bacterium]|nr:ABC transporter ATP-binding protein [Gammaproteobacteria bacterium]